MIKINIEEPASYMNLRALEEIVKDEWELKNISISYNPSKGLPEKGDYEKYPFKAVLVTEDKQEFVIIRIWSLTVGYGGSGPHDTASILEFFGMPYIEEDIYTKRREDRNGNISLNYIVH